MVDIVVYGMTLVLSTCFVGFYFMRRRIVSFRSNIFIGLMANLCITSAFALVSNHIENTMTATGGMFLVQYITQMCYFIFHSMLSPLYCLYIKGLNRSILENKKRDYVFFLLPMVIAEILVFITPLTNAVFKYDSNCNFQRGDFEYVIYIVAVFYMLLSVREMVICRETVSKKHIRVLWYFFALVIIGVAIQAFIPILKIELFFEVIALLGIMFSIECEDGLLDATSRAYNRRGFVAENKKLLEINHKYSIITISILNFKLYKKLLGYQQMGELIADIVEWIGDVAKGASIYRTTSSNIAIICNYKSKERTERLIKTIEQKFIDKFDYYGMKIDFNVNISYINVPEDFSDSDSILHVAEDSIDPNTVGVRVFRADDLGYIVRYSVIEQAIKEAVTKNRFMVNFQPIWGVEEKRVVSCEALVRLTDPKLGFIPPDEFIGVAEHCMLIGDIGFIVLEKVCQAMTMPEFKALNLNCVEVNLSIHQFSMDNFVDRVKAIIDKYAITPDMINFEITETGSFDLLGSRMGKMKELIDCGFKFSLDDYGTGYSNLSFVSNFDFVNIKSDKALLWDASKNSNSKIILEDTIRMIRKLNRNVIQEGVETKRQLDFAIKAGANYIQGYYYSKPLLVDEFISTVNLLNENNEEDR